MLIYEWSNEMEANKQCVNRIAVTWRPMRRSFFVYEWQFHQELITDSFRVKVNGVLEVNVIKWSAAYYRPACVFTYYSLYRLYVHSSVTTSAQDPKSECTLV